ncbi:transporter substrate-binding domain-containing protein [Nocardia sp. NPDC004722]
MFKTARRRGIVLSLIALALLPTGCGGSGGTPSLFQQKRVVIGVKNDQPGTSVWDAYQRTGFDIDVAYHLTRAEGMAPNKNVFNDIRSVDRSQSLKEDRVDLVVATFSITPDRVKDIDFAGPYAVTAPGFLVLKDSPIKSLDNLKGATVCTWDGTTSQNELQRHPEILNVPLPDAQDCIKALKAGQVAAVFTDQLILYGFADHDPDHNLAVVPGAILGTPNYYGIGINKEHRSDCEKLAKDVMTYVTSSDWHADFVKAFPSLAADDQWERFRPNPTDITRFSCQDKLSN